MEEGFNEEVVFFEILVWMLEVVVKKGRGLFFIRLCGLMIMLFGFLLKMY